MREDEIDEFVKEILQRVEFQRRIEESGMSGMISQFVPFSNFEMMIRSGAVTAVREHPDDVVDLLIFLRDGINQLLQDEPENESET